MLVCPLFSEDEEEGIFEAIDMPSMCISALIVLTSLLLSKIE